MKQENEKTRYSESDLQEFKSILLEKLRSAKCDRNRSGYSHRLRGRADSTDRGRRMPA